MTEKTTYRKCGNELPSNAPAGVCPRCLLLAGMGESSPEMISAENAATILTNSTAPSDPANELPTVPGSASSKNTPETVAPSPLNAKVPQDLETICLKCLEKDRRRRFQSARELVEELRRFLEGRPILSRPVSIVERCWRWCRRHPAIAALTAGIAASLVIGTAVLWTYAVHADKQSREARSNEARAVSEKQRADEQTRAAKANAMRAADKAAEATSNEMWANDKKRLANRRLYAAQMNLAQIAWEQTRVAETLRLLELNQPSAGQANGPDDPRGFEWHYWNRLTHSLGRDTPTVISLSLCFLRSRTMRLWHLFV